MKLLLVDDHALFREGMDFTLRHLDPTIQVEHAADLGEALRAIDGGRRHDLVLLDLQMPGVVDLDALLALRAHADDLPVVVLSGTEDIDKVWRAVDAGAMGFIPKRFDSRAMMTAMRVVLDGGIYLPPACLTEAGRRAVPAPAAVSAQDRLAQLGLSSRQAEVLARVVQGKPNKVIARDLGIGEATVKTHVSAVLAALGVRNRTEAVYAIARLGVRLQEPQ